jgi:hypothetical protein
MLQILALHDSYMHAWNSIPFAELQREGHAHIIYRVDVFYDKGISCFVLTRKSSFRGKHSKLP